MKKILLFSSLTLFIAGAFIACKKGENDPFLSLSSRKARLEGAWKLTSEIVTESSEYTGVPKTSQQINGIYDGTMMVTTTTDTDIDTTISVKDTVKYVHTLDISKDGTYKQIIKNSNNINITETTGTWIFLGKSKINELKKKEAILFTTTKSVVADGYTSTVIDYEDLNGKTMLIDKLSKKELVLIEEVNTSNETGLQNTKSKIEYTFSAN